MKREELQCKIYPADSLPNLKYVVVCSVYNGKIMLSKHKERNTWETQGGHIEEGESAFRAAERELFEESGVQDAQLYYVCDYLGYHNPTVSADGAVFFAKVHALGQIPESEMETAKLFDNLPDNLTYPHVTPRLFEEALAFAAEKGLL